MCGGSNGFALSRPSVRRSVRPSPLSCPLYKSYTNWRIFFQTWLKCSLQQGDVQNPCYPFLQTFTQMFNSTRLCTEPMLPLCRLKVKVTLERQNWLTKYSYILICICNWKNFFNLGSNVHLNKGMCRTHVTPWILTCIWIFLKLEKVFAWNFKYIWSVTIRICSSSFITLYCILTLSFKH